MELGRQLARIAEYGLVENKSGGHSVFIKFDLKGESLTWWGSLKEGMAAEITMRSLLECGFQGGNIKAINAGMNSNLLIEDEDIYVVVGEKLNSVGLVVKIIKSIGEGKEIIRMNEDTLKNMQVDYLNEAWAKAAAGKKPKQRKNPDIEIAF